MVKVYCDMCSVIVSEGGKRPDNLSSDGTMRIYGKECPSAEECPENEDCDIKEADCEAYFDLCPTCTEKVVNFIFRAGGKKFIPFHPHRGEGA